MTDEERKEKLISWEDMKEDMKMELGIEDEDDEEEGEDV